MFLFSGKGKISRKSWSTEKVNVVLTAFHDFITGKNLPGKARCEKVISLNIKILGGRTWTNVKAFVRNYKTKLSRTNKSVNL